MATPRTSPTFSVRLHAQSAGLGAALPRRVLPPPLPDHARFTLPATDLPVHSRDPKDDPFLACALAGGCRYPVTGDRELLALAGDPASGTLHIVTPRQFIDHDDSAGQ